MQVTPIKPIFALLCVAAAFILGVAGKVDSFSSWTLLAGVAVVPSLVMMWRWNDQRRSMSQSIQEALR